MLRADHAPAGHAQYVLPGPLGDAFLTLPEAYMNPEVWELIKQLERAINRRAQLVLVG